MRSNGVVPSAGDLGLHDHVCWIYDGEPAFLTEAERFLADGLVANAQIMFVGDRDLEELRPHFRRLGSLDDLVARGQLRVLSIRDVYEAVRDETPTAQAQVYAAAVRAAEEAGYSGVRVAADATSLVTGPDARDEFVRYEHVIDCLMADGLAFGAMCGYDAAALDGAAVDELTAIHPLTGGTEPTFAMFAMGADVVALVGEVDAMNAGPFGTTVRRVFAAHAGTALTIDASGLAFIDHRGVLEIDRAASANDVRVRLAAAPGSALRLREILRLSAVEVTGP